MYAIIVDMIELLHGDCLEQLKTLEDNSVDSIVTDPPYELGFMGKHWDNTGIANDPEMWAECLRVLKPGGHLLAFSGTRTYHRMATAIEDAGFEVRDMIEWVYGSGFPKSLNIGKAVDKMGNKIKELRNFTKWFDGVCIEKALTNKQIDEYLGLDSGGSTCSHYRGWNTQQPRYPREAHFKKLKEWLEFGDLWDEKIAEVEREIVGLQEKAMSGWSMDGTTQFKDRDITKGTSEWEGWGTALKPAHEPICMARKPLAEKTVAENCLKWGTGGINVDGSRVEADIKNDPNYRPNASQHKGHGSSFSIQGDGDRDKSDLPDEGFHNSLGRFPANLIHDNSEEVRECFPETGVSKGGNAGVLNNKVYGKYGTEKNNDGCGFGDSGNASRFFKSIIYQAKASKSERNKGCEGLEEHEMPYGSGGGAMPSGNDNPNKTTSRNNHPTVKPIALMEYLIKMVTPKGGTVLDPFMGSGSTGVAAREGGYGFIGIEREAEYIEIAKARICTK